MILNKRRHSSSLNGNQLRIFGHFNNNWTRQNKDRCVHKTDGKTSMLTLKVISSRIYEKFNTIRVRSSDKANLFWGICIHSSSFHFSVSCMQIPQNRFALSELLTRMVLNFSYILDEMTFQVYQEKKRAKQPKKLSRKDQIKTYQLMKYSEWWIWF
jgi:hypothetical protein